MKERPPGFYEETERLRKEAVSRMRKDGYGKNKLAAYEAGWDYVADMYPNVGELSCCAMDMASGEFKGMSKEAEADYIYEGMQDAKRAFRSVYEGSGEREDPNDED